MTHIIGLKVDNYKRAEAVEVIPDGNTVVIAGKNAQGKSSVLDAIFAALGGRAGTDKKTTPRPIRDGESKATIEVTLDDLVVKRVFSGESSRLEVKARDGKAKYSSPQAILDGLIGKLSFDPLEFAEADEKTQLRLLKDVVELEVDLDALARQRKEAYEQRTETNREIKRFRTVVDEYDGPSSIPDIDPEAVRVKARDIREQHRYRNNLLEEYQDNVEEIARLQARQAEIVTAGKTIPAYTAEDVEAAEKEYERVVAEHASGRQVERHQREVAELARAEAYAEELTERIEELDGHREKALAGAKFPVPGLSFGEDGVLWNGVPFAQASSAERIRVSVAMAMAMNPDLRVITIQNGSLLDEDMRTAIDELAADKDYQIWYEIVGNAEDATVVIEDGRVKA